MGLVLNLPRWSSSSSGVQLPYDAPANSIHLQKNNNNSYLSPWFKLDEATWSVLSESTLDATREGS